MKGFLINSAFCAVLLWVVNAQASITVYQFESRDQEQRFQQLTTELRCLQCQNQSIASSDAPLANDLKNRVYRLILAGKTDAEIRQYLVERYGDFISYRPAFTPKTGLLWIGPWFLLVLFLLGLVAYLAYWRSSRVVLMSADEEARAAKLLGIKDEAH